MNKHTLSKVKENFQKEKIKLGAIIQLFLTLAAFNNVDLRFFEFGLRYIPFWLFAV